MEIIKLNLIPSGVNPTCHCSQYDNGRVIRIDLFDGLTPYVLQSGDTVTLNVRKPDNTIIETSLTATQGNTYVNLVTTEQMCACVGYNLCDLTITNGSTVIGTLNFIMQVERDVLADGIPSQSVIEDLDALVAEAVGDNFYTKSEVDSALALKADALAVDSNTKSIYSLYSAFAYNPSFEQGSLSGVDGSKVSDLKTIRTIFDIKENEAIIISCESGYTYAIRYYNSSNVMIASVSFTNSKALYIAPENTVKIGVCLRYTSNITPSVSNNINILYVDETIEQKIGYANITSFYHFEQGSISGTDGSLINDTKTIRTIFNNENYKMLIVGNESGYTHALRFFDQNGVMIGTVSFEANEGKYLIPDNTAKIGICLRSTNDITVSAVSNIYIKTYLFSGVDKLIRDFQDVEIITVDDILSSKLATAINYNRNKKFANIAYFTDTHSNVQDATKAIENMNSILVTKMMNACIHGGDLITTYDLTYDQYVEEMCKNMVNYKEHGDMFFVKGNHDNNHSDVLGENATKYQYHMMMQSHLENAVFNQNDPCACYFYADCLHEKVRIIVLDSFSIEGNSSTVNIDDDQLDWLYNTALNVSDGWTVIVFSHMFSDSLTKACQILNAFAHRGTTYGDYEFPNNITTRFVGVIHGHEHYDSFSDSVGFNIIGVTKAYGGKGAVDIFTIDTTNLKLYETRIGDGLSREFDFI